MTKQIIFEDLKIFFFTESQRFEGESSDFPSFFFLKNLLTLNSSGLLYFNACGIFIEDSNVYVVFPKGLVIDLMNESSLIEHVSLMLKVFKKYDLKQNSSLQSENITSEQIEESSTVFNLLDIIEDYLLHGPLVRETTIRELNYKGRIDWRQTISKTTPLISRDTVHYLPPVVKRKVYEKESIIQRIHLRCVADSFYKFGWMYGITSTKEFFDVPALDMDPKEILRLLHAELRMTFFDRDIHVIKLMIRYFEDVSTSKTDNLHSSFVYSLYFHTIFEAMCMEVFNGINASELNIPKPSWHMMDGSIKTTSQIPDVLFIENDELYIIDAKYYDAQYTLPGWGDLVKQHFYGFSFQKQFKQIYNVFLLPGTNNNFLNTLGYSTVPDVQAFKDSTIYAFTVDIKQLMNFYISNNTSFVRMELKNYFKGSV